MLADSRLEKKNIRRAFAKAAASYDEMAVLQRKVGKNLLKPHQAKKLAGIILDIGCGTGFLTRQLLALFDYQQMIALDLALPMVQATRANYSFVSDLIYLCADAENLPLQNHSVDYVFSNLALQWCQNLPAVFNEIKQILKADGTLIFSTFGKQTLQELKTAWARVDNFTHVNTFYTAWQINQALAFAGYQEIIITETVERVYYDSVMDLMYQLKGLGAHNVTAGRNHKLTKKSKLQAMMNHYETLRVHHQIPATFEIINVFAKVKC